MPREIFADDIERFLETLDGVSSARVLTEPDGAVSYVYVTTDTAADSRALRRGVVAALQARFGIPIEDWRVRLTQLRAGVAPAEIPRFRVVRVEESATAAELDVAVTVEWARGAEVRSATGHARGRRSRPDRSRALAAAAVAAVREALDVPSRELAVDRVAASMVADRPLTIVAVSAGGDASGGVPQTFVGAAFDDAAAGDDPAEPAVAAALDAAARWLLHVAFSAGTSRQASDRRTRLEAMRRFVLEAADASAAPAPGQRGTPPRDVRAPSAGSAEAAAVREAPRPTGPVQTVPSGGFGLAPNGQIVVDAPPPRTAPSDTGPGAGAAGPRTKEGTAMSLQHDTADAVSGRAPRAPGVEEAFYRSLVADRTPVHLRCRDGYEVPRAVVRDAGTYALLVETADGLELFFKHAIISIRVLPETTAKA
jgi:sRNA-binding regulator protein Hfq